MSSTSNLTGSQVIKIIEANHRYLSSNLLKQVTLIVEQFKNNDINQWYIALDSNNDIYKIICNSNHRTSFNTIKHIYTLHINSDQNMIELSLQTYYLY